MAYSVNTAPTLEGIPSDIFNFAVNVLGWNDLGGGVVAAPGADAGVGFSFAYLDNGPARYQHRLIIGLVKGGVRVGWTIVSSPYINGGYQLPTRLHLFGGFSGAPYLAVAIEYSPGFFRHGYVGYMEKIGEYGGGEVITSAYHIKYGAGNYAYDAWEHKYPFSGVYYGKSTEEGCVRIVHPDVGADDIVLNSAMASRDATSLVANRVLGGFRDNANDPKLAAGFSSFAGSHILVPINMYRTLEANRVQPIGRPAGVRMIRMDNLDPAAPISVGNKTWRCFPVFKKYLTTSVSTRDYSDETSYIIGMAYQED